MTGKVNGPFEVEGENRAEKHKSADIDTQEEIRKESETIPVFDLPDNQWLYMRIWVIRGDNDPVYFQLRDEDGNWLETDEYAYRLDWFDTDDAEGKEQANPADEIMLAPTTGAFSANMRGPMRVFIPAPQNSNRNVIEWGGGIRGSPGDATKVDGIGQLLNDERVDGIRFFRLEDGAKEPLDDFRAELKVAEGPDWEPSL